MNYTKTRELHGEADTPLYNVWQSMRARCSRESDTNYEHYGARGITVCDEWRNSYIEFRNWAITSGYEPGLSIERRDVNGNYEPGNCTWATIQTQRRNTRRTLLVTAFGKTASLAEWIQDPRCAVSYNAVHHRLRKGWTPERAISEPRTQKGGPR